MFTKIKEPRKKNSKPKELLLPLPIPCRNQNKDIENFSQFLPKNYTAILEDNHIFVKDEWQAKCLYKCGYFGKGEYSKGLPNLNEINKRVNETDEPDEYSINSKNIESTISNEKYTNRLNWEKIKKNETSFDDFNLKFVNEFVNLKLTEKNSNDTKYVRVNYNDQIPLEVQMDKLYKSNYNPFMYKIRQSPNVLLNEYLSLMHEEAFYLAFAIGCLDIFNKNEKININDLWNLFYKYDNNFPFKYAVYHKLRSKGWVLKNGIKYGCEFMAYYEGPDSYHASFGIMVRHLDLNELNNPKTDEFSKLSALIRINETVSKEVVIIYVINTKSNNSYNDLECLKFLKINEFLVNRWVPGSDLAKFTSQTTQSVVEIDNFNILNDD